MSELVQKSGDSLFEGGPVVSKAMQMQDILAEPTPELLDGVELGSLGGQAEQLDGQGVLLCGAAGLPH